MILEKQNSELEISTQHSFRKVFLLSNALYVPSS